jgi:hypothetical protein
MLLRARLVRRCPVPGLGYVSEVVAVERGRHLANYAPRHSALASIPTGIRALSFVAMLMDISSEMIRTLQPVYLVTVLGTSVTTALVRNSASEFRAYVRRSRINAVFAKSEAWPRSANSASSSNARPP